MQPFLRDLKSAASRPVNQAGPKPRTHAHTHIRTQQTNYRPQIRGIKTNIPFLENVLRHPVFLEGAPTTAFIEKYSKALFT